MGFTYWIRWKINACILAFKITSEREMRFGENVVFGVKVIQVFLSTRQTVSLVNTPSCICKPCLYLEKSNTKKCDIL